MLTCTIRLFISLSFFPFPFPSSSFSFIVRTVPGVTRTAALLKLATAYSIGAVVGPALGGLLAQHEDYYFNAGLATYASMVALFFAVVTPLPSSAYGAEDDGKEADADSADDQSGDDDESAFPSSGDGSRRGCRRRSRRSRRGLANGAAGKNERSQKSSIFVQGYTRLKEIIVRPMSKMKARLIVFSGGTLIHLVLKCVMDFATRSTRALRPSFCGTPMILMFSRWAWQCHRLQWYVT